MKDGQAFIIIAEMKHHPYNLRGSSLEVFSALYSLTKKRAFLGSYADLASWIEIEIKTLRRTISNLQARGLVSVEEHSGSRFEFQAYHIKGYPLPDYKYCGKKSTTDAPVIDSQNINEYRTELEVGQNVPAQGQNVPAQGQNVPNLKEKNQKKNNYNIYTNKEDCTSSYLGKKVLSKNKDGVFKEEIYPPTWEMVAQYAHKHVPTISQQVAANWFAYCESGGWRMSHGNKIRNWRASLFLWDQRHQEIERDKAHTYGRAQMGISQEVLDLEERMREQRRRERELNDKEANTPEAKAAAERVFAKFCK